MDRDPSTTMPRPATYAAPREITFTKIALFLALVTSPLYFLPAGSPQIGHAFMALLILATFARPIHYERADFLLAALIYVAAMRIGADVIFAQGPMSQAIDLAFILFTTLTFVSMRQQLLDPANDRTFVYGVMGAIAVAAIGLLVIGSSTLSDQGTIVRSIGTFQNPNQLAYFALLGGALLALLHFTGFLGGWKLAVGLAVTVWLTLSALSKAGMIAQYLMLAVVGQAYLRRRMGDVGALLLILTGFVALSLFLFSGAFDDYSFMIRLNDIGSQSDDGFAERGYLVAFNGSVADFLFGLAPAGVQAALDHEVHSTIVSFLGKYGVIGMALFVAFLIDWIVRLVRAFGGLQTIALTLGFFLYGTTHNGSRFLTFWVLAGASYALALRVLAQREGPIGRWVEHDG